jgi:hypothetical protein
MSIHLRVATNRPNPTQEKGECQECQEHRGPTLV